MLDYILQNLLPIGLAVGGMVAWFLDKRKRKAELDTILVANKQSEGSLFQIMQDAYKDFSEETLRQIADLKAIIKDVQDENYSLKGRVKSLEKELVDAKEERESLIEQVAQFKKQSESDAALISQLKQKIESYEKELKTFRKERV